MDSWFQKTGSLTRYNSVTLLKVGALSQKTGIYLQN
jgi:hypothetical protein